jgi:hypothetical protein
VGNLYYRRREKGDKVALTTKQDLMKIRSRALRTRVWFKALSKVERAIVDLTIKCVERIRSNVLARTVSMIVSKLLESLEEGFMVRAERVGCRIAESLCVLGERWGNKACSTWKCDKCFIRFLGVNALNT